MVKVLKSTSSNVSFCNFVVGLTTDELGLCDCVLTVIDRIWFYKYSNIFKDTAQLLTTLFFFSFDTGVKHYMENCSVWIFFNIGNLMADHCLIKI